MKIADEVPLVIEDHDTFVEGVVADETILPAFGFAAEVVGVEAAEADDGGGVLGGRDGEAGRGHVGSGGWRRAVKERIIGVVVLVVVVVIVGGGREVRLRAELRFNLGQ